MKKYEELNLENEPDCNLLIGNGFSISFDSAFGNLSGLETTYLSDEDKKQTIKTSTDKIYDQIAYDFSLEESKNGNSTNKITPANKETLPYLFNKTLSVHPYDASSIKESEAESCIRFLKPYLEKGKVFTINYDMLILWAIARAYETMDKEDVALIPSYNDGFMDDRNNLLYWKESKNQNVFYCHGALDIEPSGKECYKRKLEQMSLLSVTRRILRSNLNHCVLVSKETYKEKIGSSRKAEG